MPQYNRRELDARAREYGFNRDTFEKVLRLRRKNERLSLEGDDRFFSIIK